MRLWPALVLAPLFAIASGSLGYALATPACERSMPWLLHLCIAVFLLMSLATTVVAWTGMAGARREFLPLVATGVGAFFSAVIAAQWVAAVLIPPCMH